MTCPRALPLPSRGRSAAEPRIMSRNAPPLINIFRGHTMKDIRDLVALPPRLVSYDPRIAVHTLDDVKVEAN